jgi:hypothetical protein
VTFRVLANPGINGYSGKPYFGVADTCDTNCHKPSGATPTLTVTVPATVQAGSTNDVTIVVNGTRVRTSLDAAFSESVKTIKGQNTQIPFPVETPDEVVAVTPPPSGASGTYKFSFVAPQTNGALTLYVAGMSANGSADTGDGVAKTTKTIMVTGGTSPSADAGPITTGDAGSSGGKTSDAGTSSDAGEETSSSGSTTRRPSSSNDSGCNTAGRAFGADAALVLVLAGCMLRRRRFTPSK